MFFTRIYWDLYFINTLKKVFWIWKSTVLVDTFINTFLIWYPTSSCNSPSHWPLHPQLLVKFVHLFLSFPVETIFECWYCVKLLIIYLKLNFISELVEGAAKVDSMPICLQIPSPYPTITSQNCKPPRQLCFMDNCTCCSWLVCCDLLLNHLAVVWTCWWPCYSQWT